ncbi:low temperature requirement protein A [Deinococcus aetherius]|uniref:Low temperature requirement protein A n=1 Tax=Deinococcus aetherius TaxID=200252 RepID=A0ABM8A8S4_9DEIO|nr:low temperature requirement protein A [Deinococcus aetherius]BDP40099.1 low temperature requirement protein A [Deinococcus aetherius]
MFRNYRLWWQAPQLHAPGEDARRVTWLELFYDLVFVVVISRLAHHLADHPDARSLGEFLLLFIPVWWVWLSVAYYNERFETYDLSFRVATFLQMLAVAGMAATAEYGLGKTATGFALSYAFARALITLMWWRAGRHNPGVRPVTDLYVRNFSVSVGLWTVAAFLSGPEALALKAAGLLIDLVTPLLTLADQPRVFPAPARKLHERFGLFVIIVLGESLVGVVNGLAEAGRFDVVTLLRFVLGLLLGFGLWWIYFDYIGRREPDSHNRWRFLSWTYLHLPLVVGITMIGAMIEHAVAVEGPAEVGVRWLLAGGFALFYVACAGLEFTLEPEESPVFSPGQLAPLRLLTAAVALTLPLLLNALSGLVLGLILLHVLHAGLGVRAWFASANAGRSDVH